ncbi:hypothetical protein APSETT444_003490 [Aspergillus pseudonomiae]
MSQKVIRLNGPRTSVRNLKAFQEPIREPSKHEVLIKVHAVSLNFRDVAVATSLYPFPVKDNVVPCSDAAGVVVKVGEGVNNIAVDDHVIGTFDISNLFGQQMNWLNGTGGVSITGLILAKAAGATTIITSSSDEKLAFVKEKYGVDYTINYKKHPEWSKEALRFTNGEGVDYIFENGGSGTIGESLNTVKMGGNISVIGFLSQAEQSKMPDVASLALAKGAVVRGIVVGSTQLLQEVTRFVARKELRLPVDKVFEFTEESIIEAYEYMASGSQIGKVCIKVAE